MAGRRREKGSRKAAPPTVRETALWTHVPGGPADIERILGVYEMSGGPLARTGLKNCRLAVDGYYGDTSRACVKAPSSKPMGRLGE